MSNADPAPNLVVYPAYTTFNETTLYIHGGRLYNGSITDQLYTLDLTQPYWPLASPPWKSLGSNVGVNPGPREFMHTMAISKDQQSLVVLGLDTGLSIYNFTEQSWRSSTLVAPMSSGLSMVTDPNSGIFYVPSALTKGTSMMILDISSSTVTVKDSPMPMGVANIQGYGALWSTLRNSLLMYGGADGKTPNKNFFEYKPSSDTWYILNTTGPSPVGWESQCMVSAQNGSKIVVFGQPAGLIDTVGRIYTFDLVSFIWTRGEDIDPKLARSGMACTAKGDNFIAWGGDNGNTSISAEPIVYNIKEDRWTNQFGILQSSPTETLTGPSPIVTNDSDSGKSSSSKEHLGAIIGSTIGGLAFLAIILVVFFRFIRRELPKGYDNRNLNEDEETAVSRGRNASDLSYDREKVLIVEEQQQPLCNSVPDVNREKAATRQVVASTISDQRFSQGSSTSISSSDSLAPLHSPSNSNRHYHRHPDIPLTAEIPYESSWHRPIKHEIQQQQPQTQQQQQPNQNLVHTSMNFITPSKPPSKKKESKVDNEIPNLTTQDQVLVLEQHMASVKSQCERQNELYQQNYERLLQERQNIERIQRDQTVELEQLSALHQKLKSKKKKSDNNI
ncbi:hypothetical protein BGZ76_010577 [Entomortierella beljakovae]|nr:hypothetical protein BGZ76_010577 [Entomortierella beljakovae]